jgi:hypothetical protein
MTHAMTPWKQSAGRHVIQVKIPATPLSTLKDYLQISCLSKENLRNLHNLLLHGVMLVTSFTLIQST